MDVIAIDGPGGSGKSTVARAVAERLGLERLDTGSMYRAVTWLVLTQGLDPAEAANHPVDVGDLVTIAGHDVTFAIRSREVTSAVSTVSAVPEVRALLVAQQREWAAKHGGGVIEGRDIGTVVFPDARVKVFLTASEEERARRRAFEGGQGDAAEVTAELARRDHLDSSRAASPLAKASDAFEIDTTAMTVSEAVERIVALVAGPTATS